MIFPPPALIHLSTVCSISFLLHPIDLKYTAKREHSSYKAVRSRFVFCRYRLSEALKNWKQLGFEE